MENKVVVHMKDGTIRKGVTRSFDPDESSFYLLPAEGGGVPMQIVQEDMKALFFVRDFLGDSGFVARKDFEAARKDGCRLILKFQDGEEMWGTAEEPPGDASGFFFLPADDLDNNVRIFVVRSSLKSLEAVS